MEYKWRRLAHRRRRGARPCLFNEAVVAVRSSPRGAASELPLMDGAVPVTVKFWSCDCCCAGRSGMALTSPTRTRRRGVARRIGHCATSGGFWGGGDASVWRRTASREMRGWRRPWLHASAHIRRLQRGVLAGTQLQWSHLSSLCQAGIWGENHVGVPRPCWPTNSGSRPC